MCLCWQNACSCQPDLARGGVMTQFAWKWQLGNRPLHDFIQVRKKKPSSAGQIAVFLHILASSDSGGCRFGVIGVLAEGLAVDPGPLTQGSS